MFVVFLVLLVASATAQTCAKPQDMCLKVGQNFMCPNGMGCIINKVNEALSYCCALTDINNTPQTPAPKQGGYPYWGGYYGGYGYGGYGGYGYGGYGGYYKK